MFHRDIWRVLQHPSQADSAALKMEAGYTPETNLYCMVLNHPQKRPPSHKAKKQSAISQIIGLGDRIGGHSIIYSCPPHRGNFSYRNCKIRIESIKPHFNKILSGCLLVKINCQTRLSTWESAECKSPQKLQYIHHEAEAYLPSNVP